jgi:hypothetical protein
VATAADVRLGPIQRFLWDTAWQAVGHTVLEKAQARDTSSSGSVRGSKVIACNPIATGSLACSPLPTSWQAQPSRSQGSRN